MLKRLPLLLALALPLHAEYDRVPSILLDAIRDTECLKVDGICHPYVIRLNGDKAQNAARQLGLRPEGKVLRLDSEKQACATAAQLIGSGARNLDLGAYQINYRYHPDDELRHYFDPYDARLFAGKILGKLIRRYGLNWEAVARYHSATASRNRAYWRKLHRYIYGF